MCVVVCPACGYEMLDPEPEWLDERTVIEELCEECSREIHGADESRWP